MSQHTDVAVIGAGQAGLAAGYHLRRAGADFRILEAHPRVGDSWRRRWDSLRLFTAARYSALPGLPFPGHRERFPGKEEVADYLETYSRRFELPIDLNAPIMRLTPTDGGFSIDTTAGDYAARAVIVATGAYQRPHIPPLAERLEPDVEQLHSAHYRNPEQLTATRVLVVGGANSGSQIAEELAATRQVTLSRGGQLRRLPRRILGKSIHWWGDRLGLIAAPQHTLRGRLMKSDDLLIGTSHRQLARRYGVRHVGRAVDAGGRTVRFDDGRTVDVDAVIWATGYQPDYSWIDAPIFAEDGRPAHRRGVTAVPGLGFLGMYNQYSRGSALIAWVHLDAQHVVRHVLELPSTPNPTSR